MAEQEFKEFDLTPYQEEEIHLIDPNVTDYLYGSHDASAS